MELAHIIFSEAGPQDIDSISALAAAMDLDIENMKYDQFVVAKENNEILGFGRVIRHQGFAELATLGVSEQNRRKGLGAALVREQIRMAIEHDSVIYLVTVMPDYFRKLGFESVPTFPETFRKKINFCKDYHFTEDQIHVMKLQSDLYF